MNTRWLESYVYADGGGNPVLAKVRAEPGDVPKRDANGALVFDAGGTLEWEHSDVRWVGNGRTVLDNKGNPVKQYEPFFSHTHEYEDEDELVEWGVTPVLRYDPVGRNVRTDAPDGTFSKVLFDAWRQESWDAVDTVLESDWYAARGRPDPRAAEPSDPDERAAWLAARNAETPAVQNRDALGRGFLSIADNAAQGRYATRLEIDVQGNALSITDARGTLTQSGPPRPRRPVAAHRECGCRRDAQLERRGGPTAARVEKRRARRTFRLRRPAPPNAGLGRRGRRRAPWSH